MTWRPEHGWPWLAGRWAVAAGAGALLGGAVWFGEPGPDRALALEPTATREVELDPGEQAVLDGLLPDGDDPSADPPDGGDPDGGDADAPGRDADADIDGPADTTAREGVDRTGSGEEDSGQEDSAEDGSGERDAD